MNAPAAKTLLCLLAASAMALACANAKRNSADLSNTHPGYKAPAPRTAAEEAQHLKDENFKRLQASLPQFAIAPAAARLTVRPYLNGKAVALSKYPDDADYALDNALLMTTRDDVIAGTPEEIRTVVLVNYHKQQVGTYTTTSSGNIPGYALLADLVIADRSIGAVIFRKTFRGDRPPDNVTIARGATQVTGSEPTEQVREFLEKLPRK